MRALFLTSLLLYNSADAFLPQPALKRPSLPARSGPASSPTLHRAGASSPTRVSARPQPSAAAAPPATTDTKTLIRTGICFAVWAAFLAVGLFLGPNEAPDKNAELIKGLIASPLDPPVNRLIAAYFNSLGVVPLIYASVLVPGSRDQPVPSWLPVRLPAFLERAGTSLVPYFLLSEFLGYGGIGPYVAIREYRSSVGRSSLGWFGRLLEFKGTSAAILAASVWLVVSGVGGGLGGLLSGEGLQTLPALWQDYKEAFFTQRLVNASSIDFVILWLVFLDPLIEDMKRRGWGPSVDEQSGKEVWKPSDVLRVGAFWAVPLISPSLYLLLRPPLPDGTDE
ncbi:unnamed protein product [Vitrella brassicaformis CCMP3155]|uniref:Uncharacterized protein n=1 Tax=Vitrella brassicaformis (strain CCMP3155) TaxID=1169540 RepID=A0A0G4EWH0_VITBC|nr:unnamed protein product [Vitrella brassicaformis CCMP3155]|eukprot:CEM03307.1 unnamed protein product [Vitrella brassicaformis CCMP3155]